jgi:uncharacterized protein
MTPQFDETFSEFLDRCTQTYDVAECELMWDESRGASSASTIERRAAQLEVRTKGRHLMGYAAVFGVEARLGATTEVLAPRAFAASLKSNLDIIALVDHDIGRVLARTKSKTLKLSEDSRGLAFDLSVPDTSFGRDVLALAKRGDLGGMSFGFIVPKGGDSWDGTRRTLNAVDLREISVVSAWPAYPDTVVNARAQLPAGGKFRRLILARRYLETL